MKKKILYLLLFATVSYANWAQSISFTAVPTSTAVGSTLTISYKYTNPSAGQIYLGVQLNNNFTYVSFVGGQGLNPAPAGTDVVGTFNIPIPSGTTPTANLVSPQNYQLRLELRNPAGAFLKGAYQSNYNFTDAAVVTPSVSVTSIPTSTQVGTNLVVNYKYTAAATGKVSIVVTKNGGVNPWDFISTVVFDQLDPAVAGTDVTGTFTVLIPNGTTPTASLTGNQNYRIILQLRDSGNNWLAENATVGYNITPATATTWTGATSTAWTNASNWSAGAPDNTKDVTIGTGTFQPIIASNASVKSLTLNASTTLTVTSGFNLTVTGAVTNSGTMTIENNANLIQGGTTNSNTGNITVKRNSNALYRSDFIIWSSPVTNSGLFLKAFSPITLDTRFYNYNETTNKYSAVASPSTTPFATASGYLIRMPNNGSTNYEAGTETLTYAGEFTGVPNNGDITKAVTYNGATFGYNMVGNPYPSTIDADAFISANTANIETGLYFWRKKNATSGSAYAIYNPLGGTTVAATAPSSDVPSGIIQVGQGFFVKAKSASNITFTNLMRVSNNANQFFKTKAVQKDRLWLNLTTASGVFSQALIGYTADATSGVDMYDAKYINDSPIALTSSINNEEYSIQGRPAFDPTDVVALNFKTDAAGDYTIALDHFDGVFAAAQEVYLVDSKTGAETNLKEGGYTFAAAVETDNARFSLKFQKTLKVIDAALDNNSVSVYQNNGAIYINSKSAAISSVKVFDIQGRLLAEQRNVKANTAVISNLRAKNQILIVNVVGEDNSEVSKKIMN